MLFPTFNVHNPLNNTISILLFDYMPRYKDEINLQRRRELGYGDTMSSAEIDAIISRANTLDYLGLSGDAWGCLFAVFWAFGKRLSEIVVLRTTDVAIRRNELVVTFTILKKSRKSRKGVPIPEENQTNPPRRMKRLTLENKYAVIIKEYWDSIKDQGGFLFPRPQTSTGHIYPKYVWDFIKMMGFEQPIWTHLFRHSLATELAQNEVSVFEMKSWFDWEKIDTADEYVSASGVSTKKVSNRKW